MARQAMAQRNHRLALCRKVSRKPLGEQAKIMRQHAASLGYDWPGLDDDASHLTKYRIQETFRTMQESFTEEYDWTDQQLKSVRLAEKQFDQPMKGKDQC